MSTHRPVPAPAGVAIVPCTLLQLLVQAAADRTRQTRLALRLIAPCIGPSWRPTSVVGLSVADPIIVFPPPRRRGLGLHLANAVRGCATVRIGQALQS
jgi:hypothetical protein